VPTSYKGRLGIYIETLRCTHGKVQATLATKRAREKVGEEENDVMMSPKRCHQTKSLGDQRELEPLTKMNKWPAAMWMERRIVEYRH